MMAEDVPPRSDRRRLQYVRSEKEKWQSGPVSIKIRCEPSRQEAPVPSRCTDDNVQTNGRNDRNKPENAYRKGEASA